MPNRTTSRYHRSSFQGLSIIEGKRGAPAVAKKAKAANDPDLSRRRNERRRRSSSLAQSHQIRDIIATTVRELRDGDGPRQSEGAGPRVTAEERLEGVLRRAKEGGHSADRIFGLLGAPDGERVPKRSFVDGLVKLGYPEDERELERVAARFDSNRDGLISLAEFRRFCYEIPSVAWKAERQRLEGAPGASGGGPGDGGALSVKDIMYAVGPEVFQTSKLFWKQGLSVNVSLRYCSDLDVISMQTINTESKEEYATLFVKKSDCAVDREALKEATLLALQASDETSDEGRASVRKNTHWEHFANYLLARLQMARDEGGAHRPRLARLHGDARDALETEKPANLIGPERRTAGRPGGGLDEFASKVRSFQRDSRQARTSRQSAQELSSVVESALNEILAEGA